MKKILLAILILVTLILPSCKKDKIGEKINLSKTEIKLYHNDTCSIGAISSLPITYASENDFHAAVDENGLVKGMYVGSTKIKLQNEKDLQYINVIVQPKYFLYTEPDIQFGENKASIINKYGEPDNMNSSGTYSYNMVGMVNYILMVMFDDNDKVKSYAVAVSSDLTTVLSSFLSERYAFFHYENSQFWYADGLTSETITKYIINYLVNVNYWAVLYIPKNEAKNEMNAIDFTCIVTESLTI